MAIVPVKFDHTNVLALTGGARLGTSGVSHIPLEILGLTTAVGSANGQFNDTEGSSHIDIATNGDVYIANGANNRVDRFRRNGSGVLDFQDSVTMLSALGESKRATLLAIDRVRNEIHIGSHSQFIDDEWIRVYKLSKWPAQIVVGQEERSYGSNSVGSASGKAVFGGGLTLAGDIAVITSRVGNKNLLRFNHVTTTILNEENQANTFMKFATDGVKWYSGSGSGAEKGFWEIDVTTFTGIEQLDEGSANGYHRRGRMRSGSDVFECVLFGGRVYLRTSFDGRLLGFNVSNNTPSDGFLWPGGAGETESYGHGPGGGMNSNFVANNGKLFHLPDNTWGDRLIFWSANGPSNANQSFLTLFPTGETTAEWTYSGFSAGSPSTLKSLGISGEGIAAEKLKVSWKKNGGDYRDLPLKDLFNESAIAALGDHTFSNGDTITLKLTMSTWVRLDGHPALVACRDKLPPENVSLKADFDDPNASNNVPVPVNIVEVEAPSEPVFEVGVV